MSSFQRLLIGICVTSVLGAQAPEKGKDPCENPTTTVEMQECALKKYRAADTELNAAYQVLVDKIKSASYQNGQRLVATQKAWIKFRDANADFEASFYDGGSIKDQIRLDALTRMTQARTKEINDLISSEFDR